MDSVTIRTTMTPEALARPELARFLGKSVEIVVSEVGGDEDESLLDDRWRSALKLAREVADYDFDAVREQREYDRLHAADAAL